jgi:hypothetical protein
MAARRLSPIPTYKPFFLFPERITGIIVVYTLIRTTGFSNIRSFHPAGYPSNSQGGFHGFKSFGIPAKLRQGPVVKKIDLSRSDEPDPGKTGIKFPYYP